MAAIDTEHLKKICLQARDNKKCERTGWQFDHDPRRLVEARKLKTQTDQKPGGGNGAVPKASGAEGAVGLLPVRERAVHAWRGVQVLARAKGRAGVPQGDHGRARGDSRRRGRSYGGCRRARGLCRRPRR